MGKLSVQADRHNNGNSGRDNVGNRLGEKNPIHPDK